MASGEKSTETTATTTSTTREKLSAFKNRAATHYTRVKQVYLEAFYALYLYMQLNYSLYSLSPQFTLERLGRAETTEYDSELENLMEQTDKIKTSTERILNCAELILQPNPGIVTIDTTMQSP